MALNWRWDSKIGEATFEQTFDGEETRKFTISLYEGNAFLIFIDEYKDKDGNNMYNMFSFFVDETHAKNCLGITKGTYNLFNDVTKLTGIRINKAKSRNWKKIVNLLTRAFDNITIELYTEE